MLLEGEMDERRLEITLPHGKRKIITVKEIRELLYKEEYAKLTTNSFDG